MALKPRYKRRLFWTAIAIVVAMAIAIIVVPPMITLNYLKPQLESAVMTQTGIPAKIDGDVHFSLLGGVLIVAHDVKIPIGTVHSAMFRVPFHAIFNIHDTHLAQHIIVYGANVVVEKLEPQLFNHDITIRNSVVKFMNKDYEIIDGVLYDGKFAGFIRLGNHRYEIEFENDIFHIHDRNNKLDATGQLYSDGSTRGQISLDTDDINGWFGFSKPKINRRIKMTANFEWDGGRGLKFHDIVSNSFNGNIDLMPDGAKDIRITSDDMEYDFTFLFQMNRIPVRTNFDMNLHGKIKLAGHDFEHLQIKAVGTPTQIEITNIIADNITITGGRITENGAENIMLRMPYKGIPATCMFSGTPQNYTCSEFSYGDITGSMSVQNGAFEIFMQSDNEMPDDFNTARFANLGRRGRVNFQFANMAGTLNVEPDDAHATYTFARGKTLDWMGIKLAFLPEFMKHATGNFAWTDGEMNFIPNDGKWMLRAGGDAFAIVGTNIKEWFPELDLRSINDLPYTISGAYNNGNISNLKINIAGQEFNGTVRNNAITLKTTLLNLDAFISQDFIDNFAEMEFLSMSPIMIPFGLNASVSLVADRVIYNGDEYTNFVYSLKHNVQTFSITDTQRGNMLAEIQKDKNHYLIAVQLNKFRIAGNLLKSDMPLNIGDTTITAELQMTTHGQIAHDITYNMAGWIDLSFDGGYITGIGIDDFYARAENITTLNAEYALAAALDGGRTKIKKLRVIGEYKNGNFETTAPIELSLRHADATGTLDINDGVMMANLRLVLRGTAPKPATIDLAIGANNARNYSLSQIMMDLDPGYMRNFVKTHGKF